MDNVMSRDVYEECWGVLEGVLKNHHAVFEEKTITMALDNILDRAGFEVEPPPILPGITGGKWIPVKKTRDVRVGNLNIASVVGVTEMEGIANTMFMAGSKGLAEAVIVMFETWSSEGHGKEALGMLRALEDMGCNVEKFRR